VAESISTLSFAQGLKRVMLSAQRKEVMDPEALIQQYQNEIAELRAMLYEKENSTDKPLKGEVSYGYLGPTDIKQQMGLEKRLNELRSLILTSTSVDSAAPGSDSLIARPLSPSKLKHQYIDMDKNEAALREELHEERRQRQALERGITDLKAELEMRPLDRDEQCERLQMEVSQLRMIAGEFKR
jgi:centromeric protein E